MSTAILEWDEQVKLVSDCVSSGLPFHRALEEQGLNYDSLRYQTDDAARSRSKTPDSIPKPKAKATQVPFVGFFSGCGGMDLGFSAAGYGHVASIEVNETFCNTLRRNNPNWDVIGPPITSGDVSNRKHIVEQLEARIKPGFEGIFIGGPPCQPFSIAANQRFAKNGPNFKRVGYAHEKNGTLLLDYVSYIMHFRPRAFLIENVPGLETVDGGEQVQFVLRRLRAVGYKVTGPRVLESADYGVPQHRKRLFIVGALDGRFEFPEPVGLHVPCDAALQQPVAKVAGHVTRRHSAESISRYMLLDYGKRDSLGRVDRLHPAKPSKTIIAGGLHGGGRSHLHPHVPRTLSVRESARLQTFPDWYQFEGPIARQFTQVGNAAPPLLMYQIAQAISEQVL